MQNKYNPNWDQFHSASRKVIKRYKNSTIYSDGYVNQLYDWFAKLEKVSKFNVGDKIFNPYRIKECLTITSMKFLFSPFRRHKCIYYGKQVEFEFGKSSFSMIQSYEIIAVNDEGVQYFVDDIPILFYESDDENKNVYLDRLELESLQDFDDFAWQFCMARNPFGLTESKHLSTKQRKMLASIKLEDRAKFIEDQYVK